MNNQIAYTITGSYQRMPYGMTGFIVSGSNTQGYVRLSNGGTIPLNAFSSQRFHEVSPELISVTNGSVTAYCDSETFDIKLPDIVDMFANGEEGAWYDPSDLSTLFQNQVGLPVTAADQPVGLMLDKRKGLALGPELVTNGDFATGDTTGWDVSGTVTTFEVQSGRLRIYTTGVAYVIPSGVTLEEGAVYRLTYEIEVVSETCGWIQQSYLYPGIPGETFHDETNSSGPTTVTVYFCGQGAQQLRLNEVGSANILDCYINNVSLRKVEGNHATQSTAGSRPLYKTADGLHWLEGDGVDDDIAASLSPALDSVNFGVAVAMERLGAGTGAEANQVSGFSNGSGLAVGFRQGPSETRYRIVDVGGAGVADVSSGVTANKAVSVGVFGSGGIAEVNGQGLVVPTTAIDRDAILVSPINCRKAIGEMANRKVFGFVGVDRAFTTSEIAILSTYLAEKSGVTL